MEDNLRQCQITNLDEISAGFSRNFAILVPIFQRIINAASQKMDVDGALPQNQMPNDEISAELIRSFAAASINDPTDTIPK